MSCRRPSNASSRVSRPVGPDQFEVGVDLDHGQAPSRRGDRVALPHVRLLPIPQHVEFGLESAAVDDAGSGERRPIMMYSLFMLCAERYSTRSTSAGPNMYR